MAYTPYLVPISCKGILLEEGRVWLRKNERDEWELPGGKLDPGEQPEQTVAREMLEELGVRVTVGRVVDNYLYTIKTKNADEARGVLVTSYICEFVERVGDVEHVGEAGRAEFHRFAPDELADLNLPDFYRKAIQKVL
jgi:8-oxo-dGTP pyrophosphatase MutT (NUDIX family)